MLLLAMNAIKSKIRTCPKRKAIMASLNAKTTFPLTKWLYMGHNNNIGTVRRVKVRKSLNWFSSKLIKRLETANVMMTPLMPMIKLIAETKPLMIVGM